MPIIPSAGSVYADVPKPPSQPNRPGQALDFFRRHVESGVLHPERIEDTLTQERAEGLSRYPARSKYLDDLALREPAVWKEIDSLIATKQPASYDRAIGLLVDLHDVAAKHGRKSSFLGRLDILRTEHARKPSFISKLQRAGLR